MKGLIPNSEQIEQIKRLTERVRHFFPELKTYEIILGYDENIPEDVIAQISVTRTYSNIDVFASIKEGKKVWKKGEISGIEIRYNTSLLLLKHGLKKDAIMFSACHELTHLLKESWRTRFETDGEDSHDLEFKNELTSRFNKFRLERNEPPIQNESFINEMISIALSQAKDEYNKSIKR